MYYLKKLLKTIFDIFPVFNRPMALCAAISAAAILFLYNHQSVAVSLLVLLAIFAISLIIITRNIKVFFISIFALAVCASAVNEFMTLKDLETLDGRVIDADFIAVEDSYTAGKVSKVMVLCRNSKLIPNNTKFSFYYFVDEKITSGDRFNASVKLSRLDDNKYRLYNLGNSVYMNCKLLKINKRYTSNNFFEKAGTIRRYIKSTINNEFDDDISSILIALNCGDKKFLSDEFYAKVIICGVSHIMVVSGLHISIIIGALFYFFEKFYYNRFLKSIISFFTIFAICAVCGFTLSVVRAGVMFLFFVISPLFLRKNDALNSLGSAVLLILYIYPFSIYSVSFLLSVTSTMAVVWISPFYSRLIISKLYIKNKLATKIVSVFTVSLCALIFTAPISMWVFGTYSLLAPITFLLITFPVTVALEFNTTALIFSAIKGISVLSKPLFFVSGWCARYIKFIIDNLGVLDFLLVNATVSAFIIFIALIAFLIFFMYLYKYYQKLVRRAFVSEVKSRECRLRKRAEKKYCKR